MASEMGVSRPGGGELGPLAGGKMKIEVVRHDEHKLGNLTPEGIEHAKQVVEETVDGYLDKNPDTNFLVMSSDQIFDETEPQLGDGGMRAHQTANIAVEAIRTALNERGLPADHLFGNDDVPVAITPELREADTFNSFDQDERGVSLGYMTKLRQKVDEMFAEEEAQLIGLSGEDKESKQREIAKSKRIKLWEMYYQNAEPELLEENNAESSADLAQRMDYIIKVAEMAAASFYKTPGKENQPLVVWMFGHGGGIDSYVNRYTDAPIEELGFPYTGGITIRLNDNGETVVDVKGKEYHLKTDETIDRPERYGR